MHEMAHDRATSHRSLDNGRTTRSINSDMLERFPAKWRPIRVEKTRQIKNLEPHSDSIGTEEALDAQNSCKCGKPGGPS
jgi:hypothetical protein